MAVPSGRILLRVSKNESLYRQIYRIINNGTIFKTRLRITANVITDEGIRIGSERSAELSTNCWSNIFSEKIIVTFEEPLVLELSTYIIGLHEAYDFHHTLFSHLTLFMLFSCLSLSRRFFIAYIYKRTTEKI